MDIMLMRSRAVDLGNNAGQCVAEMCNSLLDTNLTPEEREQSLKLSERVARGEIRELERLILECRDILANTSVSGPCPPTKDDTNKNQLSGG